MKLNPSSSSNSLFRRAPQVAVCGVLAFAIQVACSDSPSTPGPTLTGTSGTSTGGTPAGTAGTAVTTAGTTATAGTFSSAGTFATGGTGGSDTAGTATGGTAAGTGGAAAGTANGGTGGTPPPPVAYCMGKTPTPLPYMVTDGFKQSGWDGGLTEIKTGAQIVPAPAVDYCTQRVAGAVGDCSMWQWTPDPTTPAFSDVRWARTWDNQFTHPQVCLADGAKYISFYARGAVGGEKITIGGAGLPVTSEVPIVLTNTWDLYSAPLDGVTYNTFDSGLENAFSWKAEPPSTQVTFWIDNIQIVKDLPADPNGAGGAGAGGATGTGGAP